jgi:hypothetical protein
MINEHFRTYVWNSGYASAREMPAEVRSALHQNSIRFVDGMINERVPQYNRSPRPDNAMLNQEPRDGRIDPRVAQDPPGYKVSNNQERVQMLRTRERGLAYQYHNPRTTPERRDQLRRQMIQARYELSLQSEQFLTPEHRQMALNNAARNVTEELQRAERALSRRENRQLRGER